MRELVEQAAVKMSARKKAIGNAKESTVVYPRLLQSLDYEDTEWPCIIKEALAACWLAAPVVRLSLNITLLKINSREDFCLFLRVKTATAVLLLGIVIIPQSCGNFYVVLTVDSNHVPIKVAFVEMTHWGLSL